ncbi:GspH/FimT family pseudopilin [Janthinobacterium fluminis]|uniref:Type II secretion system protein H n=1 Tax=Janthinobacterium fluminis TaxID=2987524 RepID=A0ABT5K801_9BURK|nr:GspH/FimT family pseudopilin [Janthinobacterium fluminis]MDC8760570.1 GspH/FimT family pseudopilin [Janthinobacterium fluminis]
MKRARRGAFTLVELMVVLSIAAILLAAGVPGFGDMLARQQLRTTVVDLFAAISLTRSQAIARGGRVMLMPLDPAGIDWRRGWAVFVDRNASISLDPGDELIFRQGPVADGIAIDAVFSSPHPSAYLAYNGAGRSCSAGNSMAARWGSLSLTLGKQTRHIKINMLGRVRVCDPQAEPLACAGPAGD